jgi:phosphoglycolate phosphatase
VIAHAIDGLAYPDAADLVMIGDREHDVFGARTHSSRRSAQWGYGSRGELRMPVRTTSSTRSALETLLLAG